MRALGMMLVLPLIACSAGNAETGEVAEARGRGPSREYDVAGFSAVELRAADDVEVRVGPGFSVRAQGAPEELDLMEVVRDGDTLKIGRRNGGPRWGGKGVTVYVTMPRIAAATVAGSGDMGVDRVDGAAFSGAVAGSGDLSIGSLRVGEAALSVSGSGDLTGSGRADRLRMQVTGSGDIDARALETGQASVSLTGSGDVRARVDGSATVSLVGSGTVDLGERARCTTSKTGSGEVRCG